MKTILIADKYEFPAECPKHCAGKAELRPLDQGCICARCPVLLCAPNQKFGPMVEANDYREEWAAEFHEFVVNNRGYPKLPINIKLPPAPC